MGGSTGVLVVGAGPVGLSAAAELRRHGVDCRLVERLDGRLPYAKAVGIQPRTLELWDRMGLARAVLEAAVPLRGQLLLDGGRERARTVLALPPEVPYGFAALPQYDTERLLEEYLAGLGAGIERGTELLAFRQDPDGVTAVLRTAGGGEEELRARYLIGCDGAHSTVRKGLGLPFEGGALPAGYMLADVEVDWDLEPGFTLRSTARAVDGSEDLLVAVPLPGHRRYRLSTVVPPELAGTDGPAHGIDGSRGPDLAQVQTVVDRLGPGPATVSRLRWSSLFRISHRIVPRYGEGRVFVAGDAAHIHPPTGAQGMNTGIQDAVNLAWKLALVLRGEAGPALLDSYDAERRPVGEEVVGRTLRHATEGTDGDPDDPAILMLRQAQLLVGYHDGPPAPPGSGGPRPGDRAPDCSGLTTPLAAYPLRLLDVLRGRPGHVLLRYAPAAPEPADGLDTVTLLGPDGHGPGYRDTAGEFARLYHPDGPTGFLIRPDGHLAARFPLADEPAALAAHRKALGLSVA
ncbi:FAD-dependent monooxygenase [Kitasatospora sp. NPDC004289]